MEDQSSLHLSVPGAPRWILTLIVVYHQQYWSHQAMAVVVADVHSQVPACDLTWVFLPTRLAESTVRIGGGHGMMSSMLTRLAWVETPPPPTPTLTAPIDQQRFWVECAALVHAWWAEQTRRGFLVLFVKVRAMSSEGSFTGLHNHSYNSMKLFPTSGHGACLCSLHAPTPAGCSSSTSNLPTVSANLWAVTMSKGNEEFRDRRTRATWQGFCKAVAEQFPNKYLPAPLLACIRSSKSHLATTLVLSSEAGCFQVPSSRPASRNRGTCLEELADPANAAHDQALLPRKLDPSLLAVRCAARCHFALSSARLWNIAESALCVPPAGACEWRLVHLRICCGILMMFIFFLNHADDHWFKWATYHPTFRQKQIRPVVQLRVSGLFNLYMGIAAFFRRRWSLVCESASFAPPPVCVPTFCKLMNTEGERWGLRCALRVPTPIGSPEGSHGDRPESLPGGARSRIHATRLDWMVPQVDSLNVLDCTTPCHNTLAHVCRCFLRTCSSLFACTLFLLPYICFWPHCWQVPTRPQAPSWALLLHGIHGGSSLALSSHSSPDKARSSSAGHCSMSGWHGGCASEVPVKLVLLVHLPATKKISQTATGFIQVQPVDDEAEHLFPRHFCATFCHPPRSTRKIQYTDVVRARFLHHTKARAWAIPKCWPLSAASSNDSSRGEAC